MEAPIERSTVNPLIFFLSLRPILNPAQLNLQLDQALETVKVYQFGWLKGLPQLNDYFQAIHMTHLHWN